ncbi:Asd/ArgC dimerization domain-containing protein [Endozoicomonas sp. SESOKO1]|uniref:Asd/ArgC dimerization domain-containing protein n=1 Tax=Endozoicomonas sp. SESOKO1 TaxID=2828742 RepID=UPI00214964A6|nr:Asd/ArgC dimerization domain-containing protein [Endozoicomonas sp. SESOKO1]
MNRTYNIAIYAADTLAGETLVRQLEEPLFDGKPLPVMSLYPLVESPQASGSVEFHGETLEYIPVDEADFSSADFLVMPTGCHRNAELMTRAVESGCAIIDASTGAASQGYTVPVMADLNTHFIEEAMDNRYFAVPGSAVACLLPLLQKLHHRYTLSRINLVIMQPVAALGKKGVDALRKQTIELLNGKPVEHGDFAARLAYNLIPEVDAGEGEKIANEVNVRNELVVALGEELDIRVACITAPVFFGDSYVIDLDTVQPVEIQEIQSLLSELPEISVADGSDLPTLEDAAGSDQLHIGKIRQQSDYTTDLSFWMVADSFKRSAVHAVELIGLLIKDFAK